jgi:hypothetical protein
MIVHVLSKSPNVATFALVPGFDKFHTYCTTIEKEGRDEDDPIIAHPVAVISDDEAEAEPSVAQSGLDRQPSMETSRRGTMANRICT